MKWVVSIALVCLSASTLHAEESKERHFKFIGKTGDTAKVTINHRRMDASTYSSKTTDTTFVYQAKIVGTTPTGFKLTWFPKSLTVPGRTVDISKDHPEIEQDIVLEFETDETGMPVSLSNYDAVRENGIRAVEARPGSSKEAVQGVRNMFAQFTAKSSAGVFGKYAQLIGMFQGISIEVGKPRVYEDQLPNPLGPGVIKVDASLTLTAVDEAKGTATFEWQQQADPESAKAVIAAFVQDAAKKGSKPLDPDAVKAFKIDIKYAATATVRLSDGWVSAVHYEQNTASSDGKDETKRTEIYDIAIEK